MGVHTPAQLVQRHPELLMLDYWYLREELSPVYLVSIGNL